MSKQTDLGCNIDQHREDDILKDDIAADKIIFSSCFKILLPCGTVIKTILTHSFNLRKILNMTK